MLAIQPSTNVTQLTPFYLSSSTLLNAPRTEMTESDDLPDLTALFPADEQYWREFESITIQDAALLSLDIEPREILEHRQQALVDAFNSLTGALETESPLLHLGQQNMEFQRRHAVISNVVSCKTLPIVEGQEKGTPKNIRLVDFVTWASAKQWQMPTWLSELGAPPSKHSPQKPVSGEKISTQGPESSTADGSRKRNDLKTAIPAYLSLTSQQESVTPA